MFPGEHFVLAEMYVQSWKVILIDQVSEKFGFGLGR
jgi:hypothetical protein